MLILPHRGLPATNSLEDLLYACEAGFSLETDVRFSADKKLIIIHDKNLKKSFGLDIDASELNYQELIRENPIFTNRIPELDSLMKHALRRLNPDQQIALHMKDYGTLDLIDKACIMIEQYALEKKVFIFDVLLQDIRQIKKLHPRCRVGVSVGEKQYAPMIFTKDEIRPYLSLIDIIWADEWQEGLYTEDFFQYCKKMRKEVYVISPELHLAESHPFAKDPWTLWEKISAFPFRGICTDFPQEAHKFFNKINFT